MAEQPSNSALIARILEGARWATGLRLAAQLVSWGSTLVVVRFITTTDYGLNAMLATVLDLLLLGSTLGLDLALVRARTLTKDQLRPAFGFLLLLNGGLFCLYFFGGPLIAAYYGEPRLEALAKALAFVFVLIPFRVIPNALLDRELRFKLRAGVDMASSVLGATVTLTLAVLGFGIWALVVGVLVSRTFAAALLMFLQPWFVLPSLRLTAVRRLLAEGGTLSAASALAITAGMFPVLIGGPELGPAALGLFAVATQFAMLPLSKIMPIVNSIAFPAFSRLKERPEDIGGYVATTLGTGALLLLPVFVGLAFASEAFTLGVLGRQWGDAAFALALLSVVMPFRGVALFLYQVLGGVGRPGLVLRCSAIYCGLCLIAAAIGARFGFNGLVAAFAVSELLNFVVTWRAAGSAFVLDPRRFWAALRAPFVASCVMALGVLGCSLTLEARAQPLVVLAAQVAVGAGLYMGALRLMFWPETKRRLAVLRR